MLGADTDGCLGRNTQTPSKSPPDLRKRPGLTKAAGSTLRYAPVMPNSSWKIAAKPADERPVFREGTVTRQGDEILDQLGDVVARPSLLQLRENLTRCAGVSGPAVAVPEGGDEDATALPVQRRLFPGGDRRIQPPLPLAQQAEPEVRHLVVRRQLEGPPQRPVGQVEIAVGDLGQPQTGLVQRRKEGRWHFYRLVDEAAPEAPRQLLKWMLESLADDPVIREDRGRLETVCKKDLEELSACYRN